MSEGGAACRTDRWVEQGERRKAGVIIAIFGPREPPERALGVFGSWR